MTTFEVDSETFDVTLDDPRPGSMQVVWLSGRNPGYGFTSIRSDGQRYTDEQVEKSIRAFLRQIDPTTGFLADD